MEEAGCKIGDDEGITGPTEVTDGEVESMEVNILYMEHIKYMDIN